MSETPKKPLSFFQKVPRWALVVFIVIFSFVGISALVLSQAKGKPSGPGGNTNAQLYLSTPATTVSVGDTTTVSIRLNPPQPADGVEATINYDASQFEFVSFDTANSAFPIKLQETNSPGTLQITRGIFAPDTVSGDSLVADIKLKALKAVRNGQLSVQGRATAKGGYLPALTIGNLTIRTR